MLRRRPLHRTKEEVDLSSRPGSTSRESGRRTGPTGRPRRAINAAIFGALIGAAGGAVLGQALFDAPLPAALLSAVLFGAGEAATDLLRPPGALKPLAWRVATATFFGAVLGALIFLIWPQMDPVAAGLLLGLAAGLLGLHWQDILLGSSLGLALGLLAAGAAPPWNTAVLGALVFLSYRLLAEWLFRNRRTISLAAERVPADEILYVVPFEAHSGYIGSDYFKELARSEDGTFQRNAPGIGIVASLDELAGPTFDPALVDPLIREFYEHTSRFKLAIVPEWQPLMKPLFLLYKRLIAQRIGQANLPFNQEEAQRGVVSYIDTIDLPGADALTLRGWVRAFAADDEAIYVGIYTTFSHNGSGYVSVGFPLPESNFTATLIPHNKDSSALLLTSRDSELAFPGHYLTFIEEGELTVMSLDAMGEEIEVYVQNGRLLTDHRFYLGDRLFLTLHYTMQRAELEGVTST